MRSIFRLALNDSGVSQTFYTKDSQPIIAALNQVIDTSQIHGRWDHVLHPVSSFVSILKQLKVKKFYIERTFALGDVLMLVPVVRYLEGIGFFPYLRVSSRYLDVVRFLGLKAQSTEQDRITEDYGIKMDGIVEQDHVRGVLSSMHRVDIVFLLLGLRVPKKLNWTLDDRLLPKVDNYDVVFQSKGSTLKKQLPLDTIKYLEKGIEAEGYHMLTIGDKIPLSIERLFATIKETKCLVCMDSAPLWISHFTRTPVVVIFGPTRPGERITRHPLYPEGTIGVELSKEVGCEPCFERAVDCNGRIDCFMDVKPERVFRMIKPHIEKFCRED